VVAILRARLGAAPSSRLKTTGTLIDKLRGKTALSRMQDIAGCRIVQPMSLREQDDLVQRIVREFPGSRVIDRRENPSHGYRAVHVVVKRVGFNVEIQVRTELQNLWAQLMERLADVWGRQIRYGGEPHDPGRKVVGNISRQAFIKTVMVMSDACYRLEKARNRVDNLRMTHEARERPEGGTAARDEYEAEGDMIEDLDRSVEEQERELRLVLRGLHDVPDQP